MRLPLRRPNLILSAILVYLVCGKIAAGYFTNQIGASIVLGATLGGIMFIVFWPAVLLVQWLVQCFLGSQNTGRFSAKRNAVCINLIPVALFVAAIYHYQFGKGSVPHLFEKLYGSRATWEVLCGGYERDFLEFRRKCVFVIHVSDTEFTERLMQPAFKPEPQDEETPSYANFLLERLTFSAIRVGPTFQCYHRRSGSCEEWVYFDTRNTNAVVLRVGD